MYFMNVIFTIRVNCVLEDTKVRKEKATPGPVEELCGAGCCAVPECSTGVWCSGPSDASHAVICTSPSCTGLQ